MVDNINEYPFHCATAVQLRFNDLDTLGHVNNSVYFQLFDLGKTDYFNRVNGAPLDWQRVTIMLVNVNCDFVEQTRFDEPLEVVTRMDSIGNSSLTLLQLLRNSDTGAVKCVCRSVSVHLDLDSAMPARVPDRWREAIARFEHRDFV